MTWIRATVPTGPDPDVRSRHLLLVDGDVAVWRLRWTDGGWFLNGAEPCRVGGDGELADAVSARELPAVLFAELRWLRGGE